MILDSITYKLIYPKSYTDANFERFEFMFGWVGRCGELYQWLFENWIEVTNTEVIPINEAMSENTRSLIFDELINITLTAENINRNELDVFKDAKVSQTCIRIYKNGTVQKLAVVSQSTENLQNNRFNFSITVQLPRNALAK